MKRMTTALALIATAAVAAPAFAEGGYDAFKANTQQGTDAMSTRSASDIFVVVENSSVPRLVPADTQNFADDGRAVKGISPEELKR